MKKVVQNPSVSGQKRSNTNFGLYLSCTELNVFGGVIGLPGHSLNRAGDSQSDKFEVPEWSWDEHYRNQEQIHVVEPERTTQVEFEIHTPARAQSVLFEIASGSDCDCDVWEIQREKDCDYCDQMAILHLPSAPLHQPKPTSSDKIPGGVDNVDRAARSYMTNFYTASEGAELFPVTLQVVGSVGFTAYSILALDQYGCDGNCYCPGDIIVGGEDGFKRVGKSGGQYDFVGATDLDFTLAATSRITDMIRIGGKIVGTFTTPGIPDVGGVFVYDIEADTMTEGLSGGASIATGMKGIAKWENRVIAVGDGGAIYYAALTDLSTWTALTQTVTVFNLTSVDVDGRIVYIGGDNTTGVAYKVVGNKVLDITATALPAAPGVVVDVHVFGDGSILFAMDDSRVSYTNDDGDTWTTHTIGSGSSVIATGDYDRLLIASDGEVYEHSVLTLDDLGKSLYYQAQWQQPQSNGLAGIAAIVDAVSVVRHGLPNFYFAVTSSGEVVYGKPCNTILC